MKYRVKTLPVIQLDTKDPRKSVALKDVEYFASAGCRARLVVNSNGFMCERPFEFDNAEEFLHKITRMREQLAGEARLAEDYSQCH